MVFEQNDYNFQHPNPNSRLNKFPVLRYDPELERLKQILIDINLWETDKIQALYKRAKLGTSRGRQEARTQILQLFEDYKVAHMESGDPYMPYATIQQISNNGRGIHILNQAGNNIEMRVPQDVFLYNTLVLGRPGGGKSSAVFYILKQIDVPTLTLDPKNIWRRRAAALNSQVIEWPYSVGFEIPPGSNQIEILFLLLEGISQITGIQYGLVPLAESRNLVKHWMDEYIAFTGKSTAVCVKDILDALDHISLNGLKKDYVASAKAALMLLTEPNNLFVTRNGLPIAKILDGKYILPCHALSRTQSITLAFYLSLYQLVDLYDSLESSHLKSLTVYDDSSNFINCPGNAFGTAPTTGIWTSILPKKRGTGRGDLFIDQVVESIFDDVKQSCTNWMIVGGLRDTRNFNEIAAAMNLTREQADYIGKMKTAECIAYFPMHYPRPVHGFIPRVSSIDEDGLNE